MNWIENKKEYIEFLVYLIKSFVILLMFGEFLPRLLDYILFIYLKGKNIHDDSILVQNILTRNSSILKNYIYIFHEFLKI
ncbi:endonuclease III [Clostridium tetani]|uniref:Endonuclease III n=1 Tax=Clostridium tetani TaxID=1513 RepID=A0A4Q0VFG2_CLOTA|nr:endonuclease III [Clostridium tetani]RXI49412.1 endonuclease III [Clostridium tetani]